MHIHMYLSLHIHIYIYMCMFGARRLGQGGELLEMSKASTRYTTRGSSLLRRQRGHPGVVLPLVAWKSRRRENIFVSFVYIYIYIYIYISLRCVYIYI